MITGYTFIKTDWNFSIGDIYERKTCSFVFYKNIPELIYDCDFDFQYRFIKINILGDIIDCKERFSTRFYTNKFEFIKELSIKDLFNNKDNFNCNKGNYNQGDWNLGDCNIGCYNVGDLNRGSLNQGNKNFGDHNIGNNNTGNWNYGEVNTGNWNFGNYNTGDWNKTNFSNGCFNTEETTISLFNKPSNWTYKDWLNSEARHILGVLSLKYSKWKFAIDMTVEEKIQHPEYKILGGYLQQLNRQEVLQNGWNELSEEDKNKIKSLPNFDADIFREITGITI